MIHVHVGTADFFETACYIVIFGFLWRALAAKWSDNAVGQAMSFIF